MTYEEIFSNYVDAVGGGNVSKMIELYAEDGIFHDDGPTTTGRPPYFVVGRDEIGATLALIGSRGSTVDVKSITDNEMLYDLVVITGATVPCKGTLTLNDEGLIQLHRIVPTGPATPPTKKMVWVPIE
jgi:hypothetical protein